MPVAPPTSSAASAPWRPAQSTGRERLSLNEVISETLEFLRRDLQANDVKVVFEAAPELPSVEADRTQLQQVLVNLAVNAEQAMVQGGIEDRHLTIRTVTMADGVTVEIEDNGPGIPPELSGCLFDSFVTTKPNGLGIGLSICRSIVDAHGGSITAVNGEKGACFAFTLPAEKSGENEEAAIQAVPL